MHAKHLCCNCFYNVFIASAFLLFLACSHETKPSSENQKTRLKNSENAKEQAPLSVNSSSQYTRILLGAEYRNLIHFYPSDTVSKDTLLMFLDPQGIGKAPLKKYRALATRYDLAASDFSRNGLPMQEIAKHLRVALDKLKANSYKAVFLIGFSGGGRAAFFSALTLFDFYPNLNVISCGAGMHNPRYDGSIPFNYSLIVGKGDFNLPEIARLHQKKTIGSCVFDGGHQWPPQATLQQALNSKCKNQELLSTLNWTAELDNQRKLQEELFSMSLLEFKKQLGRWNANKAKNHRKLAFAEFATYMLAQRAFLEGSDSNCQEYLRMLELVNPQNADAYVLRAKIALKENEVKHAMEYLKEAVTYGFRDAYAIERDQEFAALWEYNVAANVLAQVEDSLSLK